MKLTLALPRDELSVPVVRRILRDAMCVLGVERGVVADIELALTEACTNVLDHATDTHEYEVSAGIDGDRCILEVVDRAAGSFDGGELGHSAASSSAEEGRGIQLMRALVDRVEFTSKQQHGTVVHLEKQLLWHDDSIIRQLTEGQLRTEQGPWSREDRAADGPRPADPAAAPEPV